MTKILNQIIFFSLHQNQNIFFSNIGNQNIFLEKNHTPPPPPLQVKWSFPNKNSESDFFFFLHQNQNIFFSNIGNQNIFLGKNHTPPLFKLNGRSLGPGICQDLPSSGYMKTILLMPNCLFLNVQLLYQYYHLHV